MLVVYDNDGTIYFAGNRGENPVGIPYLNIEIPEGKYLVSIDTSKEPHTPVFKEYPKTDMDILKEENTQQQADIDYLLLILG